jgi:hypothetical protein
MTTIVAQPGQTVIFGGPGNNIIYANGVNNITIVGNAGMISGAFAGDPAGQGGQNVLHATGPNGFDPQFVTTTLIGNADFLTGFWQAGGNLLEDTDGSSFTAYGVADESMFGEGNAAGNTIFGISVTQTLVGDAVSINGNPLNGGPGIVLGPNVIHSDYSGAKGIAIIYGDAEQLQGYVQGGHNTIYASQDISTIYGEAIQNNAVIFVGGYNLIIASGEQQIGTIPGQNVIIYGDFSTNGNNNATGGHNSIYLSGSTGTVYGDCATNMGVFVGGYNTIVDEQGNYTIYGGVGGNNTIYGGSGNNTITGGMLGGNTIYGGSGNNSITGGGVGNDTFIFASVTGHDTITDFDQNGGTAFNQIDGDKIDLSSYHLNPTFGAGGIVVTPDGSGGAVIQLSSTAGDGLPSTITLLGVHPSNLTLSDFILISTTVSALAIQSDYLGITRTSLPLDQATTEDSAIDAGTTTEAAYVNSLLSQVAATTIPAVAVDALMNGAVGSSAEITSLATQFLPGQLAYFQSLPASVQAGAGGPVEWDAAVTGFALSSNANFNASFVSLNSGAHAGTSGNTAFSQAVSTAVFGNTNEASTALAILNANIGYFTTNATAYGLTTHDAIAQAADGLTFGEMVGIALTNPTTLGSALIGQVTNFLEDAAQGTAIYSAPLTSQPTAGPFQGTASASVATTAYVQVTGVATPVDHTAM